MKLLFCRSHLGLLTSQAVLYGKMFPTGIEPAPPVPETGALSTELRERH
jgi:hypothetical protein